jgi:hypothetical protein
LEVVVVLSLQPPPQLFPQSFPIMVVVVRFFDIWVVVL